MRRSVVIVLAVAVVVIVAASAYFLWFSAPPVKQELVVRLWADVDQLDPQVDSLTADFAVITNIYNALVRFKHGTGEIEPDLAESWSVSDDGLTWTFKLRKGVKWHNSSFYGEFNASDVKYSYERIMDPETGSPWLGEFGSVESITVVDEYTVAFKLKYPYPGFIYKVSAFRGGFILNKKAVELYGEDYGRNPIGTGPFVFDHWGEKNEAVLVANEEYFEGRPKLDKVTFIGMTEESVGVLALEAGEIHMTPIQESENYKTVLGQNGTTLNVVETATTSVWAISFQTNMTPFTDVRVRRALYHATNRTEIVEIREGLVVPTNSFLAPAFFGATEDVTVYEYDVDKAKQLLAEAGYPDGFTTTAYTGTTGASVQLFTIVQSQWAKVGVNVELKALGGGEWFAAIRKGEPPVTYIPLGGRPPDPDIPLTMMFHTDNWPPGLNFMLYGSQEGEGIDDLLEAARKELDDTKRRSLYEQMQQKIAEEVPCIPLWHGKSVYALRMNVKGFKPQPLAYIYGRLNDVYLEREATTQQTIRSNAVFMLDDREVAFSVP
ncbi:MAG: ABC transporter substrate-binding protein [Candidatus Bathyarchaeia archaeon]